MQLWKLKCSMLFLLAVCSSCGNDNKPISPKVNNVLVIMPLEIGNHWIIERKYYDAMGEAFKEDDTLSIIGETKINGQDWFVTSQGAILRNSPEGLVSADDTDPIGACANELKYPAQIGDTWKRDSFTTLTVISTDTLIKIPCGEFHCLKYLKHEDGEETKSFYYVSPAIGILRVEYYALNDNGTLKLLEVTEVIEMILHKYAD